MTLSGMPLEFLPVRVELVCEQSGALPAFLGATLRGAFGTVFKRLTCLNPRPCTGCDQPERCAYGYVFETPVSESTPHLSAQYAPHPFVLTPASNVDGWRTAEAAPPRFREGDRMCVDLTLFGRACSHLNAFVRTFEAMGRAGFGAHRLRFNLDRLVIKDADDTTKEVRSGREASAGGVPRPCTFRDVQDHLAPGPLDRLELLLLTPVKLVVKGNFVRWPDAPTLFRALFRRLSTITRLHCGVEPNVPFETLLHRSERVRVKHALVVFEERKRFSTRQRNHMDIGGLVGRMELTGELESLYPWLVLGQHVHLGKGTSFGLGKYRVLTPDRPDGEGGR